MSRRLGSTIAVLVYCSSGKEGRRDPGIQTQFISKLPGKKARKLLRAGRRKAFRGEYKGKGTWINRKSPRVRAIDLYTGFFWRNPGLKRALRRLLGSGIDVVVLSGGLALVHLLEPIHDYNAQIKDTQKLWRPLMGRILGDYLRRQRIQYLYVACSADYQKVLRSSQALWMKNLKAVYWCVPHAPEEQGTRGPRYLDKLPRLSLHSARVTSLISAGRKSAPTKDPARRFLERRYATCISGLEPHPPAHDDLTSRDGNEGWSWEYFNLPVCGGAMGSPWPTASGCPASTGSRSEPEMTTDNEITVSVASVARAYLRDGFKVIPVPAGKKEPHIKGWQRLNIPRPKVAEHGLMPRFARPAHSPLKPAVMNARQRNSALA